MTVSIRPQILTHPNIPKPLHGVAPRAIKGREWWDKTRQEAYKATNFRCAACGIHKNSAAWHPWLEAHEYYDVDYKNGVVRLIEIVALCHSCHNFIHSGRMTALWEKKEIESGKAKLILEHGFRQLRRIKAKPNPVAAMLWCRIKGLPDPEAVLKSAGIKPQVVEPWRSVPWDEWYLDFEGRWHYSLFEDEEDWAAHYNQMNT